MTSNEFKIEDPKGKLGVLLPGIGAISSTFIAGIFAARKGLGAPIGSLTQMNHIRLGRRDEKRNPLIKDFIPLHKIDDLVFGGWDIFDENVYESAINAGVLDRNLLEKLKPELSEIRTIPAVFDKKYVKNLRGTFIKKASNKYELYEMLRLDIQKFKKENDLDNLVMIWNGSTEIYIEKGAVHESKAAFENGLKESHPDIAPSMIYAWAAIAEGIPFTNGSPNLTADFPAMYEFADEMRVPLAGKDYKTGQTLMKTILAPGLKARMLGIEGWFSTNIL